MKLVILITEEILLEKFIFGIILLANLPLIIRIVNSRFTKNKTDE